MCKKIPLEKRVKTLLTSANNCMILSFFFLNLFKFDLHVQDAGVEVDPLGDLNTESERKLGQLVLEK